MLGGFLGGLLTAWILSLFNVDIMVITFMKEMFGLTISHSSYYVGFGLVGLISSAFSGIIVKNTISK